MKGQATCSFRPSQNLNLKNNSNDKSKRPEAIDQDGPVRLSKLMSERGLSSRREADELIERGHVRVNGVVVKELGVKFDRSVEIEISGVAREKQENLATIILNKPIGYVSNLPEDGYEPAIRLIQPETHSELDQSGRKLKRTDFTNLAVVGRLDIDSQGLLLFTQDGRLAKHIIGEDSNIEKEYLVRVTSETGEKLGKEGLEKLRYGLSLDGQKLKRAHVEWINQDQLRFVLTEGKKRQIRRMCELVGLKVVGLKRVRIASLRLGKLAEGRWRFLSREEIKEFLGLIN